MAPKSRIDRNAKIDTAGHLKSSMAMLSQRAASMGKAKIGDLIEVPLDDIVVSAQVRTDLDDIQSLADAIKEEGQRSPVEVYYNEEDKLALLSGERRYRSLQAIKASTVRAIIVKPPQDVSDKILRQLSENEERESLTPMDRGRAYSQLKEAGLSQSEIARRVRRNRMVVRRHIQLYEAPEPVRNAFLEELVTDLHAIELLVRVLESYPDDFSALMETARKNGGMGRETLENWLEWRESPQAGDAPMGATEDVEQASGEEGADPAPMGAGETETSLAAPMGADGVEEGDPSSETSVAPMGAGNEPDHDKSVGPAAKVGEGGRPLEQDSRSEPAPGRPARPEKGGENEKKSTPAVSPTTQILAAHYQEDMSETASPLSLRIEVSAKLLDGKTKITGRMLTDRVDQDSEWVWVMDHDTDKPLRVKAKSVKVLSVTA